MSSFEKFFVNRFNTRLSGKRIQEVFDHLTLGESPELLELGAGNGAASLLAFDTFAPKRLVVTDYDPLQVAEARKCFEAKMGHLPDTIEFRTADALNLQFSDASFDMIYGFHFLHHLEKRQWQFRAIPKGLDEILRVLKPGGIFVYGETYSKGAIRRYLESKDLQELFSSRHSRISEFHAYSKGKERAIESSRPAQSISA